MRKAGKGTQIPKASLRLIKEFESDPEKCECEEGEFCILGKDFSRRISEDRLEESQLRDFCSNLSKK